MDNAATTRVDDDVIEVMLPFYKTTFGNPSSIHSHGRDAYFAIKEARIKLAKAIGCSEGEIYFTSGGSEADNWAIISTAKKYASKGKHIISSAIEHHAVLHTLEQNGFDVTYLPVNSDGFVSPSDLEAAIRPDTILVTIMLANNEIGAIQPVKELAAIAKQHKIMFHTDAVQAVGHIPVNVKDLGIDMLSISAHKFNAPKGVGALYIRKGVVIPNLITGGAQEKNRRAGTENTPAIVGMGYAIEKAINNMDENIKNLSYLRDKLAHGIMNEIPYCKQNSPKENCLPGIVNISINFIEGEALLLMLDLNGISASSGSACTSGSLDPSHVLLALGLDHGTAHGSLRFSLDHYNTEEEVDYILEKLPSIVKKLREISPLWEEYKNKENL